MPAAAQCGWSKALDLVLRGCTFNNLTAVGALEHKRHIVFCTQKLEKRVCGGVGEGWLWMFGAWRFLNFYVVYLDFCKT